MFTNKIIPLKLCPLSCEYLNNSKFTREIIDKPLKVFFSIKVLTKDSVTVSVDAVVYYRVSNATVSVANVENAHHSTRLLAQTTLRNILGTKNLHEILSDRESISGSMQVS